jgi:hypothetical protein
LKRLGNGAFPSSIYEDGGVTWNVPETVTCVALLSIESTPEASSDTEVDRSRNPSPWKIGTFGNSQLPFASAEE